MSLLTIVQDAAREIGLPVPSTAYGNTDENVAQLVRLSSVEGQELALKFDWQVLQKEQTFSALAQETQTSMLPSDFGHFIDETFYNRTRKRTLAGPLSPQEWQVQKSLTATVVVDAFRQRGGDILVIPVPTAGDTFAFEYVSKYWVDTDSDGDGDAVKWAADSDTALLNEELITQGLIWRYKSARGFDYAENFRTYEMTLARLKGDDGGKRTMSLGRPHRLRRPVAPQTQEGSWNLS